MRNSRVPVRFKEFCIQQLDMDEELSWNKRLPEFIRHAG